MKAITRTNMVSPRSGRPVNNQYIIHDYNKPNLIVFQSYASKIAVFDLNDRRLTLGHDWDYSNTTRKYLYQFIRQVCGVDMRKPDVERAIKAGEITYDASMR